MRSLLAAVLLCSPALSSAAEDGFDDLRVHFGDLDADPSQERGFSAFQGTLNRPLRGAAFYEAVGRSDLAARYRLNDAIRWSLVGGGALATVAGATLNLLEGPPRCADPESKGRVRLVPGDGCLKDAPTNAPVYYAVVIGGMTALVAGLLFDPHPVDAAGARMLAADFNRSLRTRTLEKPAFADLRVDFAPGPGGAAVAISGTY
jgi:hypothetical protein